MKQLVVTDNECSCMVDDKGRFRLNYHVNIEPNRPYKFSQYFQSRDDLAYLVSLDDSDLILGNYKIANNVLEMCIWNMTDTNISGMVGIIIELYEPIRVKKVTEIEGVQILK